MSTKKKLSTPERLRIWQEMLLDPEGVTYEQFCRQCGNSSGVNWVEYDDQSRQDLKMIRRLIQPLSAEICTTKVDGKTHFSISEKVDLVDLLNKEKVSRPYQEMLNLLTRMKGFLPEDFLSELSSTYKSIAETKNDNEIVVAFETDYSIMAELKHFSKIYRAIGKQTLVITRHRMNFPELQEQVIICPEFLKQHNSEWYILGSTYLNNGECLPDTCIRIPLALIDSVDEAKNYPYRHSGIDYTEYFDEIIGVENDPNCTPEEIRLRVSREMYNRLKSNPLHSSQRDCKELNIRGYKGLCITVRKNKELIRTLLNLGKDIEVVAPEKLRRQIAKELRSTLKHYE